MIYAIGLAALCVSWLLPGHYFPWTGFQQEALAAGGACLVALGVVVTVRDWPTRIPVLAWTSLLLAMVPLLQWASGMVRFLSDALLPACYLVGFALMVIAGMQLARSNRRFVGSLFATLCAAAIACVGLGLAQWLHLGPYGFLEQLGSDDRIYANLIQPNHMASLLGLGVAGILWCYESRRIGGWVASLALAFLGFGFVMTQSRAAWMFVLVFVALWGAYRERVPLRAPPAAVITAVGLYVLAVLAWGPLNLWLQSGIGTESIASRAQSGHRWVHWQTIGDAILRSPWLGYGWGQVSLAQQAAVLDHPATFEWLSSSHNQLLDLLVWNGLPLGLLTIGVIAWWAVSRMRRCADLDSWALIVAMGVLFVHSMVEFPFQYTYFLLPAGLMIGAIEARMPVPDTRASLTIGRGVFGCTAVVMAGLLYLVANEYLKVEESVRRVRLRDAGYVQRGVEPNVPDVELLDAPREYVRMWMNPDSDGMSEAELNWLRAVVQRYPSPPALMRHALAAGLSGRIEESRRTLQVLCHISLEKHCDQGRKRWAELTERYPRLSVIRFPDTPAR